MAEATQLDLFDRGSDGDSSIIAAERHPKRYESHKYWGRKPFNIVRKYISEYSKEGDLILDPFCGSGVTIFEALALKRNAIGYDLNPIACFIARNLIQKDINILSLTDIGNRIVNEIESKFPYYDVICDCGNTGKIINGVWEKNSYIVKYYHCPQCGNKMSHTNDFDKRNVASFQFPDNLWYPKDNLPDNADERHVYELFTKRNLLALGLLLDGIRKIKDATIKDLLLYTFTSNVAFTSRIIPVNKKRFEQKRNCTGIWGFKRFWVPDFHVENNVFRYFRNRLKRTVAAKNETNQLLKSSNAFGKVINTSSEKLQELGDRTVDFIFTDPPFGNMIPYLNLSTLWNSWLQFEINYEDEIIIDNKHGESDYYSKILSVLKECHRVLKDGKYLIVAFNNKSIKTWCILLEAIHNAGFIMKECIPTEDGEVSFTQTTKSAKGSLRGHFVYVFNRTDTVTNNILASETSRDTGEARARIEDEIVDFVNKKYRSITEIYNHVIPFMANNRLLNRCLKDDIIDQILRERCVLVTRTQERVIEGELVELKSYFWELR